MFPPSVLEPIRQHVEAKRCLCTIDARYWDALSPASKHCLVLQEGRYTHEEVEAFMCAPFAEESLSVRRYDVLAKVKGRATPSVEHYLQQMTLVALG